MAAGATLLVDGRSPTGHPGGSFVGPTVLDNVTPDMEMTRSTYAPDMSHRVLLVEDETDIVSPLVKALEREGYAVDQATTGKDAISKAVKHEHDVVILDLGLPDMDGLDVCRRLRDAGYQGAVLMLTGRTKLFLHSFNKI